MSTGSGGFRSRSRSAREAAPKDHARRESPRGRGRRRGHGDKQRPAGKRGRVAPAASGVDASRRAAYDTLAAVRRSDAYANLVLPGMLRDRRIKGRDAAFATELAYGTLRSSGRLDRVIAAASSRALDEIDPEILDALRLGSYQILSMRVSSHAAVDTTVRLVSALGHERASGFVNAVLRTIVRTEPEEWLRRLTPADPLAAVAFRTAHPEWIARSFASALGERSGELEEALTADSQRPRVHLAALPGEITAEELALITGGEVSSVSPYGVRLGAGDPGDIEPVRQGLARVQDEGSQLIALAYAQASVPGDRGRWLDLCAGPGGKAALAGALARIEGAYVDAVEPIPHRAELVRQATRGLPVTVHEADGRDPGLPPGFDRVLVDAPCSGLGALRRRPEARWRKTEADIATLRTLQSELLASAVRLVRPGGVIVYATCSPDLRETRGVVDGVLARGGIREEDARSLIPAVEDTGPGPGVQLWPHRHGTDAMFFAVLRRE